MKKYLSVILSFALLFSAFGYVSVLAEDSVPAAYELGDANNDTKINAADALLVLQHAARITTIETTYADVSGDGNLNAGDALLILQYVAHIITSFPASTPVPTEPIQPTETVQPTDSPQPTETAKPTDSPQPTETAKPTDSPQPTETVQPTATPTPTPTPEPLEQLKTHIQENGINEDSNIYSIGYSYEDDTVNSVIRYDVGTDTLEFDLTYFEVSSESETMVVSITMDYVQAFDDAQLFVKYENSELIQTFEATTPLDIENITTDTNFKFTETASANCSTTEKNAILYLADDYLHKAFVLWDELLKTDLNFNLTDLGFTNYIVN